MLKIPVGRALSAFSLLGAGCATAVGASTKTATPAPPSPPKPAPEIKKVYCPSIYANYQKNNKSEFYENLISLKVKLHKAVFGSIQDVDAYQKCNRYTHTSGSGFDKHCKDFFFIYPNETSSWRHYRKRHVAHTDSSPTMADFRKLAVKDAAGEGSGKSVSLTDLSIAFLERSELDFLKGHILARNSYHSAFLHASPALIKAVIGWMPAYKVPNGGSDLSIGFAIFEGLVDGTLDTQRLKKELEGKENQVCTNYHRF